MGLEFFSLQSKVLEGVKEPLDLRQSNVRLTIGLLIFIVYLLIGAAVYSAIEAPVEEQDAKKLRVYLQKFRSEFVNDECLTGGKQRKGVISCLKKGAHIAISISSFTLGPAIRVWPKRQLV